MVNSSYELKNDIKVKEKENIGRKLTEEMFGDKYSFEFTCHKYDRADFRAVSKSGKKYVGEIKCYRDSEHPRNHDGNGKRHYDDYQIDFDKLFKIQQKAELEDAKPILIVHFTDRTMVWNLNEAAWKDRGKWVLCNSTGVDYGASYKSKYETYLRFGEAVYGGDDYR